MQPNDIAVIVQNLRELPEELSEAPKVPSNWRDANEQLRGSAYTDKCERLVKEYVEHSKAYAEALKRSRQQLGDVGPEGSVADLEKSRAVLLRETQRNVAESCGRAYWRLTELERISSDVLGKAQAGSESAKQASKVLDRARTARVAMTAASRKSGEIHSLIEADEAIDFTRGEQKKRADRVLDSIEKVSSTLPKELPALFASPEELHNTVNHGQFWGPSAKIADLGNSMEQFEQHRASYNAARKTLDELGPRLAERDPKIMDKAAAAARALTNVYFSAQEVMADVQTKYETWRAKHPNSTTTDEKLTGALERVQPAMEVKNVPQLHGAVKEAIESIGRQREEHKERSAVSFLEGYRQQQSDEIRVGRNVLSPAFQRPLQGHASASSALLASTPNFAPPAGDTQAQVTEFSPAGKKRGHSQHHG